MKAINLDPRQLTSLACGLLMAVCGTAQGALSISNGDFETGGGVNIANVTDWFDFNPANFWEGTWQSSSQSPNGTSVAIFSSFETDDFGIPTPDANDGGYLYQSIGTADGSNSVQIQFEWGAPTDDPGGRNLGMTVGVYAYDGVGAFTPADGTDVRGGAGVTLLDSVSFTIPSTTAGGQIETEVANLDLTGAGTQELFLRFNNYLPSTTESWPILDNVAIGTQPVTFEPELNASPRFVSVGADVQLEVVIPAEANATNTVMLMLANDNTSVASLPGGNPITLTFNAGATNVQVLTVPVIGTGVANVSVVTNETFSAASISLGTPVSVEEEFDYDEYIILSGLDGGTGFGGPWSSLAFPEQTYTTPGLTSQGLVSSGSSGSVYDDTAFRPLPGPYGGAGGGTVWVGFLIHDYYPFVEGAAYGGFSLFNGTNSESLFMGLTTYITDNGKYGFTAVGQNFYNFDNSVTPATNTAFLVYRIDFPPTNGGNATVTFYANPAPGDNPPFFATGSASVPNFSFDRVRLSTDTDQLACDEIRIGSSWTNVAPVSGTPPPPTPLLSVSTRFGAVGQSLPVTLSIPPDLNVSSPFSVTIANDNPGSFSLSPGNPALVTLDFAAGATNSQTFDVSVTATGEASLTVVSNAQINTATVRVASQVSAVEPFDYANGLGVTGNAGGGSGWGDLWGTGTLADQGTNIFTGMTELPKVTAGLSYPGLLSSGNGLNVKGSTASQGLFVEGRTFRPLDRTYGGVGGGTVWASFLLQGGDPFTWTNTPGNFGGMSFFIGGNEEFLMGLSSYEADNGNYGFMRVGPNAVFFSLTNSVPPSTNVTHLVTRLDFPTESGGTVAVTFYANPDLGPVPPAVPTGQGTVPNFQFDTVRLACDNNMNYDEVRIGGTWSEVVPAIWLEIDQVSASQVHLTWPASLTGFELQSTTTGLTSGWGTAGLGVVSSNGLNMATDGLSSAQKYYRLRFP